MSHPALVPPVVSGLKSNRLSLRRRTIDGNLPLCDDNAKELEVVRVLSSGLSRSKRQPKNPHALILQLECVAGYICQQGRSEWRIF